MRRIPVEDADKVFKNASAGDPIAGAWIIEHYVEAESASLGIEPSR